MMFEYTYYFEHKGSWFTASIDENGYWHIQGKGIDVHQEYRRASKQLRKRLVWKGKGSKTYFPLIIELYLIADKQYHHHLLSSLT